MEDTYMKILIACEESQRVCIAFREKGHEAYSCDLDFCSGGRPEWHIWNDVSRLLNGDKKFLTCDGKEHYIDKWDMIIAFPPCTYLTKAGANLLYTKSGLDSKRYDEGCKAASFFYMIWNANCDKVVIENPIPMKVFNLPEPSQVIEPYYFGEPVTKKTCLWIRGNLPLLSPTKVVEPTYTFQTYPAFKNCNGKYRQKARSKTFPGVAKAMALSWGGDWYT